MTYRYKPVVGRTVEEATLRAIALEGQARWHMLALSPGKSDPIPLPVLKRARKAQTKGEWNYGVASKSGMNSPGPVITKKQVYWCEVVISARNAFGNFLERREV